jgi:hypothetical protein
MAERYRIGRDLTLVEMDEAGAELEGICRLPPGRFIVLSGLPPAPAVARRVLVMTWRLQCTGRGAGRYRGRVEWDTLTYDRPTCA